LPIPKIKKKNFLFLSKQILQLPFFFMKKKKDRSIQKDVNINIGKGDRFYSDFSLLSFFSFFLFLVID